MASIEEGSGVTVCVCSGSVHAMFRHLLACVCVCVKFEYCTESVGLILLCAPVGFEVVSCFLRST